MAVRYTNQDALDYAHSKINPFPWKKWFAWRPVRVNGKLQWMTHVYRQEKPLVFVIFADWVTYKYGTILDVLKDGR